MKVLCYLTLREDASLKMQAAAWFHSKWNVPQEAYESCMQSYLEGRTEYGWYLCMDGDKIVAGLGVIDNDFHDRKDLSPNVCAVYTEADYRCRGIAGALLNAPSRDVTREALAAAIVEELLSVRRELSSGAFMDEYRENSAVLGKEIRYIRDGISQVGIATHINEYGHLYVLDEGGRTQILSSGEISVRFK